MLRDEAHMDIAARASEKQTHLGAGVNLVGGGKGGGGGAGGGKGHFDNKLRVLEDIQSDSSKKSDA